MARRILKGLEEIESKYISEPKRRTLKGLEELESKYIPSISPSIPLTSKKIIEQSPVIKEIKKDLPKTKETSRFLKRFTDSATLGITGELDKRQGDDTSYRDARSFKDDAVGASLDWAATLSGYLVPGTGWIKGAQKLSQIPKAAKFAKGLLAKEIPKTAKNRLVKSIKQQAKEGIVAGTVLSSAEVGVREAINPDDYSAKDNIKLIATGALGGAVLDPLVYAGGKGIIKAIGKLKKTPEAKELKQDAEQILKKPEEFTQTAETIVKETPKVQEDFITQAKETKVQPQVETRTTFEKITTPEQKQTVTDLKTKLDTEIANLEQQRLSNVIDDAEFTRQIQQKNDEFAKTYKETIQGDYLIPVPNGLSEPELGQKIANFLQVKVNDEINVLNKKGTVQQIVERPITRNGVTETTQSAVIRFEDGTDAVLPISNITPQKVNRLKKIQNKQQQQLNQLLKEPETKVEKEEVLQERAVQPKKLTKEEIKVEENISDNERIYEQNKQQGIEYEIGNLQKTQKTVEKEEDFSLKKLLSKYYTRAFDKLNPLKKLDTQDVYENKADAVRANSLARRTIEEAQVDLEGTVLGKSLDEIMESVGDREEELLEIIILRHAADRKELGSEVFSKEFMQKYGATTQGLKEFLDKYKANPNNKIIMDAANDWNQFFKNVRTLFVKDKVWTKEFVDMLEKKYPNYAPFLRDVGDKTAIRILKEVKKGGSIKGILNPLVTAKQQMRLYYNFLLNNRANVALVEAIQKNPEFYKNMGIEIQGSKKIGEGKIEDNLDSIEDEIFDIEDALSLKTEKKEMFIYAVKDNVKTKIKISDPEIYHSFAVIPQEQRAAAFRFLDGLEGFTKAIKRSATGLLAPVWTTKSVFYDTSVALLKSEDPIQHLGLLFKTFIGSLYKADKYAPNLSKMAQAFYNAGGGYNSVLKTSPEFRAYTDKKSLRYKSGKINPFSERFFTAGFVDYFENANRIAAFNFKMKGKEPTPENIRKAMEYARNITTDYTKRGTIGIELEKLFPFTSAALSGTNQLLRFMFRNPLKTATRIGVGVLSPALYEYFMFKDDEDYKNIVNREKYRNLFIGKNDKGEFIKIPIEPQLGAIKQLFLTTLEDYRKKDPDTWNGAMDELLQIYLPPPISGVLKSATTTSPSLMTSVTGAGMATSLSPFVSVLANKNFAGIPIIPLEYELQQTDEKFKYDDKTSAVAKGIGKLTGMNPFQVDYIIKTYGGDFAKYTLPFTTERGNVLTEDGVNLQAILEGGNLRSDEWLKNFLTNPTFTNKLAEEFYFAKNELERVRENNKKTGAKFPDWYDARLDKLVHSQSSGSISKQLSTLKQRERAIAINKNLSKKERQEQLKRIAAERNILYTKWNSVFKKNDIPRSPKR
jgi:hypothetical protein